MGGSRAGVVQSRVSRCSSSVIVAQTVMTVVMNWQVGLRVPSSVKMRLQVSEIIIKWAGRDIGLVVGFQIKGSRW